MQRSSGDPHSDDPPPPHTTGGAVDLNQGWALRTGAQKAVYDQLPEEGAHGFSPN